MKPLVFASSNLGKISELRGLFGEEAHVQSLADYPQIGTIDETASTFEGNAELKARAVVRATAQWALADDSGLVVDALDGRPGVFSARYAPTEAERIDKLLGELQKAPASRRTARFVCVLCLASPKGEVFFARGACEGSIGFEPRGSNGFGYDPVFVLPSGRTLAELSEDEKSKVSHRGNAFRQMRPLLISLLNSE
jgi:XTP/dITP diphosphohydrolase